MTATPRAIDPDFVRSLADGLTESYEAYTERLAANSMPSVEEPGSEPSDEEAAS